MKKEILSTNDKALAKFTELIIERIEQVSKDWKTPWFSAIGGLHRNLDGRAFTGMNQFMLSLYASMQDYQHPYWGTFEKIASLNYDKNEDGTRTRKTDANGNELPFISVSKGEKSFPVFLFTSSIINRETKERITETDYNEMDAETRKKYFHCSSGKVLNEFNIIAQTNIKEARPDLYEKLTAEYKHEERDYDNLFICPVIDKMIEDNLYYCPIMQVYGDRAYYSISEDKITIPERKQFKDGESFIGNTLHECSHATGAEKRNNRKFGNSFGSSDYAKEELIAELSAAFVCSQYGIVKHLKDDSAAYLKNWLSALKKDANFVKTLMNDVQKSANLIIKRLTDIQTEMDKGEQANFVKFSA